MILIFKGISPWDGNVVEFTCVEIGNALPPFIECFEQISSLNFKIVFFLLYKNDIYIYNPRYNNI